MEVIKCPLGTGYCDGCSYLTTAGCCHPAKQKTEWIEIPFGARDSETLGWEYTIPEDMEAKIEDGKIIVKKKESEDEKIREWLIRLISTHGYRELESDPMPCNRMDILSWLERQKCSSQREIDDAYLKGICDAKHEIEKLKSIEWSDEDENRLKNLYDVIDKCDWNTASKEGFKKFLKSLKSQNRWKPSDEQIEALDVCCRGWTDNADGTLESLYNDLKKLKGE